MKTLTSLFFLCFAALAICPAADVNFTGLSAVFESVYFGGSTDPFADSDGDGVSNYDEFAAGTGLKDVQSFLQLRFDGFSATGSAMLSWRTVAGVSYQFQSVGQVSQSWSNPGLVVVGDGGVAAVSSESGAESAFFRLVVLPR